MKRSSCCIGVFVCLASSIACHRGSTPKDAVAPPLDHANSEQKHTSTKQNIKEIKHLYLTLSDQLLPSDKQENQDLAKLARAVSEASDEDVQAFIESGYAKETANALAELGDENTPQILTNDQSKYAAISLMSLGAISLGGGLITYKPLRTRSYAALGIGIASMVIGGKLLRDPSDENKESAQKLALSSGIVSVILGIGSVAAAGISMKVSKDLQHAPGKIFSANALPDEEYLATVDRMRRLGLDNMADLAMTNWLNFKRAKISPDIDKAASKLAEEFTKATGDNYNKSQILSMKKADFDTLFRSVMLKFHPDKTRGSDEIAKALNTSRDTLDTWREYSKLEKTTSSNSFSKRMLIGGALAALGTSLIVASQTSLQLTGAPPTPADTLLKINRILVSAAP